MTKFVFIQASGGLPTEEEVIALPERWRSLIDGLRNTVRALGSENRRLEAQVSSATAELREKCEERDSLMIRLADEARHHEQALLHVQAEVLKLQALVATPATT